MVTTMIPNIYSSTTAFPRRLQTRVTQLFYKADWCLDEQAVTKATCCMHMWRHISWWQICCLLPQGYLNVTEKEPQARRLPAG